MASVPLITTEPPPPLPPFSFFLPFRPSGGTDELKGKTNVRGQYNGDARISILLNSTFTGEKIPSYNAVEHGTKIVHALTRKLPHTFVIGSVDMDTKKHHSGREGRVRMHQRRESHWTGPQTSISTICDPSPATYGTACKLSLETPRENFIC